MTLFRLLICSVFIGLLTSCASGTAPAPKNEHDRTSIRYLNKGVDFYNKGCFRRALENLYESHERFSAADDLIGVAHSLNSIANTFYQLKDYDSALMVYDDALALYQILDHTEAVIKTMTAKAAALIAADRLEEAEGLLGLAERKQDTSKGGKALLLKTQALLSIAQKDLSAAEEQLRMAIAAANQETSAVRSSIYYTLGYVYLQARQSTRAQPYLLHALTIDKKAAAYHRIAKDLAALGDCHSAQGQTALATSYYQRSAKIFALLGDAERVKEVMARLETAAPQAGIDIRAGLYWIDQWIKGQTQTDLCR